MKLELLRDRNLRILLAGQTTNLFGTTAMIIVLGIWVKSLTGSSGAAGLIFLLLAVSALFAPLTGLLVDRFPRRRVLLFNDALSGVLIATLLLVHGRSDVWWIYVVAVGYGFSGQIYRAARGGLLHSMVPTDLLGDTNGLFSSLSQGMRIIGPLMGAALYAGIGGGAVAVVDALTFFVSAGSYLLLRRVPDLARLEQTEDEAPGQLMRDLVAGARHVATNPVIRRMVIASTVAFTGAGMIDVAMFALVDQGLHRPPALIGVLGAIQGVGSVLAGFTVGPMMRRFGEYSVACVGFLLNGVGLAAASTATLVGAFGGDALIGLGLPMVLVAEITLLQKRTPSELQGRAIAASDAIIEIPFAVAIGVAAVIIASIGFRPIYLGVAAGFTIVGLVLLPYRHITRPVPGEVNPPVPEGALVPSSAPEILPG